MLDRDEVLLAEVPVALDRDEVAPVVSELLAAELSPSATVSMVGSSNHSSFRGSLLSVVEVPCEVPALCDREVLAPRLTLFVTPTESPSPIPTLTLCDVEVLSPMPRL